MSPPIANENADPAAFMLAEGVESCNPEMIREAVSRGARANQLPGRRVTPLEVALNKCLFFEPRAEECIATLVELGASIDGEPERTPTVLECTAYHHEEEEALRLLKIVVPLGANVNAVTSSGDTALSRAVARDQRTLVAYLLDHGADPKIKNSQGISAIDWLEIRIAETSRMFSECWKHKRVKSLLTGESLPKIEIVRPQLAECLSVDLANVTANARFFDDLNGAADDLRYFNFEIQKKLGVSIESVIDRIAALCDVGAAGKLTAHSLALIAACLPGWSPPSQDLQFTDLWTVSMIEALVQWAIDNRAAPVNAIDESIGETWTEDLHREIGDRGFRLLLAGGCRLGFKPYIKSKMALMTRLPLDAVETLERFADTGKGKPALKKAQKEMMETFGQRRGDLADPGIHAAFAPEICLHAPPHVWKRIDERFGLSGIQALREFVRLSRDIVCPLEMRGRFENAWRTPKVVEIATQMYEQRDFRDMFRLANALQQAGCNDRSILRHCRDPQWIHIRGCWLVDAVLDGRWAAPTKPKKQAPTLLAKLPKVDQLSVKAQMDTDGAPLEEFLATRWDVEAHWGSRLYGDVSRRMEEANAEIAKIHPGLTGEQIRILLSLKECIKELNDTAIARRVVLDDPSELARGLSVIHRVQFALRGHLAHYGRDSDYLGLYAVREISIAQQLEAGRRHGQHAIPSDGELAGIGMTAIMKRDLATLQMVVSKMPEQKVDRYLGGYYTSLTGVATTQPNLVSAGLQEVLDSLHRMRDKDWRLCVIKLQVQGLYRLFEWFDPKLVAEFDVQQGHPWDAEFHQWCEGHPDPLEGLDLSPVSKELHDIVILRQPPAWLPKPPPLYEVVLIDRDANSKALAELVGCFAGAKTKDARKRVMNSCPISLSWNLDRRVAERDCQHIKEAGGIAEARIMQPTPARFLESVG